MMGLGVVELVVIFALVLFIFGWGRLPQLSENMRQAVRNFKVMVRGGDEIDVTPTALNEIERKESHHVR